MARRRSNSAIAFSPGTVLHNPLTAEWARLLEASSDRVVAEVIAPPGGGVRVTHRHPRQTESFAVVSGELTVVLDGEIHVHGPGARATFPPGAAHCWTSTGVEPLHAQVTASPPLNFANAVAAIWGLCALGRARPDGSPGPLDAVLLAEAFADDIELCSPPRWVQRAAVATLAQLIRATGRTVISRGVLQAAVVDPDRWPGALVAGARP